MTTPDHWRRDPQPLARGREVALALAAGIALLLSLGALAGVGLACFTSGNGWVWPHGTNGIGRELRDIATGHPTRIASLAGRLEEPGVSLTVAYVWIAASESTVIGAIAVAGTAFALYHRPSDARRGMATAAQARRALGLPELRSARAIIRPDLYQA